MRIKKACEKESRNLKTPLLHGNYIDMLSTEDIFDIVEKIQVDARWVHAIENKVIETSEPETNQNPIVQEPFLTQADQNKREYTIKLYCTEKELEKVIEGLLKDNIIITEY